MDKEREDMLDDLFEYYDTGKDSENDNDIEKTTIVDIPPSAPAEETLGDTVVVNTAKKIEPTEHTIQIESIEPPKAPREETFGILDRVGNVIEPTPNEDKQSPKQNNIDVPPRKRRTYLKDELTAPSTRPTSKWFILKPLWITLILCAITIGSFTFYVTDSGPIGIYKRNFSYNMTLLLRFFGVDVNDTDTDSLTDDEGLLSSMGLITTAYAEENVENQMPQYSDGAKKKATVPFPGAGLARYAKSNDGVVCAKSNYIGFINKNGHVKWEHDTTISDPIISASGDYVALASVGNTQLCLYKNGKQLFALDTPESIKICNVSENGDVVVVTEKTAYKGAVSVYNNKGEEVFSWVSGVNHLTSASITKNRHVSVSLVNTESSITSYVMVFDIFSPEPLGGAEFKDTLIYDSTVYSKNTFAYGDNSISCIDSQGRLNYNILFDDMTITHTSDDENGWRLVSYIDNHIPYINVYDKKGKLKYSTETEVSPQYADLYKSYIVYNNGRDVICGKTSNPIKDKYTAPMTVKNLVMVNSSCFMIAYENSLEFIKF